jgi:hypothetical protein
VHQVGDDIVAEQIVVLRDRLVQATRVAREKVEEETYGSPRHRGKREWVDAACTSPVRGLGFPPPPANRLPRDEAMVFAHGIRPAPRFGRYVFTARS